VARQFSHPEPRCNYGGRVTIGVCHDEDSSNDAADRGDRAAFIDFTSFDVNARSTKDY